MRSAGIIRSFISKSISAGCVPEASADLTHVRSCHSIKQRVETERLDITNERISLGSSSGRNVGMYCFFDFSKAIPTPEAGLASINPVLTA